MQSITHLAAWQALEYQSKMVKNLDLANLFETDPKRFNKNCIETCELVIDYSRNLITDEIKIQLLNLAESRQLNTAIERLFSGDKINLTEHRAALHTALRNTTKNPLIVDGEDIMPQVNAALDKMSYLCDELQSQRLVGYSGKPFTDIVNIGVGGSHLGPEMITNALKHFKSTTIKSHFASSADGEELTQLLESLNPETTLFVVVSKSFNTLETITNAESAKDWILENSDYSYDWQHNFIGVSANKDLMSEFGILEDNQLPMWNWVGGRFSLWSPVGISIAMAIGMDNFKELLQGAHEMDHHFRTEKFERNAPVMLGLIDIWYINFMKINNLAIVPYSNSLKTFPSFLQQLFMESLGKSVTNQNLSADYETGAIIWGEVGPNAQHAFFQLLHQGKQWSPIDFIVPLQPNVKTPERHKHLSLASAIAQSQALMEGQKSPYSEPYRSYPGNRPSTIIAFPKVTPRALGSLIALYEHRAFVQSVIWDINAFDQWGVELGKAIAQELLPALKDKNELLRLDKTDPTRQLIEKFS